MFTKHKRLSIKQLESCLQDLDDFDSPRVELEQYATPPHIAALMLNTIDLTYNDLKDRFVADLGCGTGRLSVGSLLSGAALVFGFDIDGDALKMGLQNVGNTFGPGEEHIELSAYQSCANFNFLQVDVAAESYNDFWSSLEGKFDTVIMNPPFGTKQNPGLDMIFLKRAIKLTNDVVYSLHKTSTRSVSLTINMFS